MKFTKMHGCGNDYIYVNCLEETVENPKDTAIKVSDVHFGIGSDGLILVCPSKVADFRMAMYNADGSEGKMCGNGIRCVGKYVYDNHLTDKTTVTIETLSGIKTLELTVKNGKVEMAKVDMGAPILQSSLIPAISDEDTIINKEIQVNGENYNITCVSMGNPHCVTVVNSTKDFPVEKIGPYFEKHEMFPDRVNTEFVEIISRKEINMRVWERGSGETWACGTGTCASVVACVLNDLTEDEVLVHVLGGDILVHYDRNKNTVFMTGPAATICTGEIDI
jgi:diaminopimelate epimerase